MYHGKVLELRDEATKWLEYIPASFPHFTQHTASHSEEIVRQVSKLLFRDNDPDQGVLELSPVEAYVLIAAAYLHDAGMVVSDLDKVRLLGSDDWRQWVGEAGPGHQRWLAIHAFRESSDPPAPDLRDFLSDVQLRYVIAEYFRRTHHERVLPVLAEHQGRLGRFAFDDPSLLETIGAVCVGHGLSWAELDDNYRFPDRRDVRGDDINVRLVAVLLRLGDLLDMRSDRACPLLLSAASPLPPESAAHWSQYQRVRHRDTAPDSIEIDAECETADEHRVLQDWCQWLCDEVAYTPTVLAGSRRHAGWEPPIAKMTGPGATVSIRPAPGATYIPSSWAFELDAEAVVTRLVESVSPEPLLFVRELLQNALDATRCRLSDLYRDAPEGLSRVTPEALERLSITVRVSEETIVNPFSGEDERAQIIEVNDHGVGMSAETVERYLLQIGRSFYTTPAFRRQYSFNPTSRFGVGFLSVFRDSDHVEVETSTGSRNAGDSATGLRLTLTGPRTYLLVERSSRSDPGTAIRVRLRSPATAEDVRELVRDLCRRVEFPVFVETAAGVTTVQAERADDFVWVRDAPGSSGELAEVRALPFADDGVSGELYIAVYAAGTDHESWADRSWLSYGYLRDFPGAALPPVPTSVVCFNGLAVGDVVPLAGAAGPTGEALCVRMDYRRPLPDLGLARAPLARSRHRAIGGEVVTEAWTSALEGHLASTTRAQGDAGWRYRQRLMQQYPLASWWPEQPHTTPHFIDGVRRYASIAELDEFDVISVLLYTAEYSAGGMQPNISARRVTRGQLSRGSDVPVLVDWEVNRFSDLAADRLFDTRAIAGVRAVGRRFVAVDWQRPPQTAAPALDDRLFVAPIANRRIIGFRLHRTAGMMEPCVLNSRSPFVQWLLRIKEASAREGSGVTGRQYDALANLLDTPLKIRGYQHEHLAVHLAGWAAASGIPVELRPPDVEISRRAFVPPTDPRWRSRAASPD